MPEARLLSIEVVCYSSGVGVIKARSGGGDQAITSTSIAVGPIDEMRKRAREKLEGKPHVAYGEFYPTKMHELVREKRLRGS
jgi:hypothetical protein